ncbi:MAG: hypothetical protein L0312_16650, partial [Acidobacteria bacterium]|nr:hypothetical protein [Acidobacteriota bacterium]
MDLTIHLRRIPPQARSIHAEGETAKLPPIRILGGRVSVTSFTAVDKGSRGRARERAQQAHGVATPDDQAVQLLAGKQSGHIWALCV